MTGLVFFIPEHIFRILLQSAPGVDSIFYDAGHAAFLHVINEPGFERPFAVASDMNHRLDQSVSIVLRYIFCFAYLVAPGAARRQPLSEPCLVIIMIRISLFN